MNRKSLYLFVIVAFGTAILLVAGWLVGLVFGVLYPVLFAGIGGVIGAWVSTEIAFRKGYFEAEWDRLGFVGPYIGLLVFTLAASWIGANGFIVGFLVVLGAGLGALISKYLLRFFVNEPPLSIK